MAMKAALHPNIGVALLPGVQEALNAGFFLQFLCTLLVQNIDGEVRVFHVLASGQNKHHTLYSLSQSGIPYKDKIGNIIYFIQLSYTGFTKTSFPVTLRLTDRQNKGAAALKSVAIEHIQLHPIALPLVEPLKTSFGAEPYKSAIIVEITTKEGLVGWGETALKIKPSYGAETMLTALHITRDFLIPKLRGQTLASPTEVPGLLKSVRGNHHARAGIEAAIWDAMAQANEMRLADYFAAHLPPGNAPRDSVAVGVSIGIQDSLDEQLALVRKRVDEGYGRIKLKIAPGWDVEPARAVRQHFPDILLMLDANSAYTLADAKGLKQLDKFDLMMIEQPLAHDDIYEHSKLQPRLRTPICLDESIHSAHDWQTATRLGAAKILNLKPTRVGGYTESLKLYQLCVENSSPLWIGGMLETGIGRAANLAFASLPGVTLPSDISATNRYFDPDIAEPPFVLQPDSRLSLPQGRGIGVDVQRDRLQAAKAAWREYNSFAPLG